MKQEDKNREPMSWVLKHVKEQLAMEDRYDEANKERNEKRNAEYRKEWERTLQKENDHWALEILTGDALADYFGVLED